MDESAARRIIECLADGLDPTTGELLDPGSPIESPEVIRALHVALRALDRQIQRHKHESESSSNAGKPWYPEDDRSLAEAFNAGQSISVIAKSFRRTEGSIASRLVRIGKVSDRQAARVANRSKTISP